jgi:hypothetical protein
VAWNSSILPTAHRIFLEIEIKRKYHTNVYEDEHSEMMFYNLPRKRGTFAAPFCRKVLEKWNHVRFLNLSMLIIIIIFFFFVVLELELRAFTLSHSTCPFCDGYF